MLLRKILSLGATNTGAQLILIVSMPFIANLYGSKAFGEFSLFLSISIVIMSYSYLRLDLSILMQRVKLQREKVKSVGFLSSILLSILSSLIAGFVMSWDWQLVMALIFYCIFNSFFILSLADKISNGSIVSAGVFQILRAVAFVVLQILLYYIFVDGSSLLIIISLFFSYAILMLKDTYLFFRNLRFLSVDEVLRVLRINKDNVMFSTLNSVVSSSSNFINVYFINESLGAAAAGLYFFIMRMFQTPIGIVGKSVSDSMLSSVVDLSNYQKSVWHVTGILVLIASVGAGCYLLLGDFLLGVLLDDDWDGVYGMSLLLLPWLILQFVNPPLISKYRVLGREKLNLSIVSAFFIIKLSFFMLSSFDVVKILAISGFFMNFTLMIVAVFLRDNNGRQNELSKNTD
jgi:O-antigen/teichoic acid export membrane protein